MSAAKNPARGETHPNATLSDHDVRLILELLGIRDALIVEARKLTDKKLAEKFDVHHSYIWRLGKRGARITARKGHESL